MPYIIGVGDVRDNREVTLDLRQPVPPAVRRAVSPDDLRKQLPRGSAPVLLDQRGRVIGAQAPAEAPASPGAAYRQWLQRAATGRLPGVDPSVSIPVAVTSLIFAPLRPFDVPGALVGEYLRARREGTPPEYSATIGRTLLPEVYGAPTSTLAHETYLRVNPQGREASLARRAAAGAAGVAATVAADPLMWLVPLSHVAAVGKFTGPALRTAVRAASPILEEQVAATYGRSAAREAARIVEDAFMRAGAARIPSAPELLLHSATGGRLGAAMPTVEQLSARISPTLVATGAQSEVGRVIDAMNEALRALEARGLRPPSMAAEPGALAGSPLGAWAQTVMSGIVHAGRPQWRYWGRPLFPYRGYDPGALGELERAYVRAWGPTAGRTNLQRVLQVAAAGMEADRTGDPTRFAEVVARITGRPAEQVAEAAGEAAGRERILREVIRTYGGPDTEELTMRLLRRRAAEEVAGGPRAGPRIVDVPFEEEGATAEGGFRTVWNRVTDLLGRFGGPSMREAAATRATAQRVGGDVAQDVGASLVPIAREWAARAEPIVEQALADIQPALDNYRAAWALVRRGSDVDIGALGSTPLGTTILELLRENGPMPLGALTAALEQIAVPAGLTERLAQGIRYTVPTEEKPSDYSMGPVVRAYAHEMARAGLLQQWQLPPEAALEIFGNPTDTLIVGPTEVSLLPTEAQLEAARAAAAPAAPAEAAAPTEPVMAAVPGAAPAEPTAPAVPAAPAVPEVPATVVPEAPLATAPEAPAPVVPEPAPAAVEEAPPMEAAPEAPDAAVAEAPAPEAPAVAAEPAPPQAAPAAPRTRPPTVMTEAEAVPRGWGRNVGYVPTADLPADVAFGVRPMAEGGLPLLGSGHGIVVARDRQYAERVARSYRDALEIYKAAKPLAKARELAQKRFGTTPEEDWEIFQYLLREWGPSDYIRTQKEGDPWPAIRYYEEAQGDVPEHGPIRIDVELLRALAAQSRPRFGVLKVATRTYEPWESWRGKRTTANFHPDDVVVLEDSVKEPWERHAERAGEPSPEVEARWERVRAMERYEAGEGPVWVVDREGYLLRPLLSPAAQALDERNLLHVRRVRQALDELGHLHLLRSYKPDQEPPLEEAREAAKSEAELADALPKAAALAREAGLSRDEAVALLYPRERGGYSRPVGEWIKSRLEEGLAALGYPEEGGVEAQPPAAAEEAAPRAPDVEVPPPSPAAAEVERVASLAVRRVRKAMSALRGLEGPHSFVGAAQKEEAARRAAGWREEMEDALPRAVAAAREAGLPLEETVTLLAAEPGETYPQEEWEWTTAQLREALARLGFTEEPRPEAAEAAPAPAPTPAPPAEPEPAPPVEAAPAPPEPAPPEPPTGPVTAASPQRDAHGVPVPSETAERLYKATWTMVDPIRRDLRAQHRMWSQRARGWEKHYGLAGLRVRQLLPGVLERAREMGADDTDLLAVLSPRHRDADAQRWYEQQLRERIEAARAEATAAGTAAAPPAEAPADATAAAPPTATGPAGPPSQPPPPPPAPPAAVQPPEPMRLRAGVPLDVRAVIRANLEVLEGRADYLRRLLEELRDPAAAAERERLSQDLAAEGYIREVEAALPKGVRKYFREVARATSRWYGLRPAEVYKLRFGLDNADAASARLAAAVEQALHNVDPRMDAAIGWWGGTEGTHVLRQDLLGMPAGTEYTFPLRDRVTGLLRILGEPLPADAFIEGETLVRERLPRKAQQAIERAEELLRLAELAYEGGPGFPGLAEAGVPRKPSTYWPKLPNLAAANDEQLWLWAMYGLDPEEVLAYTRRGARTSIEQEATYQDQFTRLLAAVEAIRGERAGGAAVSSDSVLRMLPGVSASAAWRDYVRVAHAVVRRQAVVRWLRDMFTSVHEARSVSPGLHEQMAAAGWGPVRITTPGGTVVLPGTEDLLVPPQVQDMVSGLLASPSPHSDAALLERVAHTGRALVYRGAVNMLRTASFGVANLLEQLWNNFAAGVLTDRYGLTAAQATAIFMRVWPEMILQANLGVTQRGLVDIFREAFARAGREVARFLTPYLTDEQARAWAEVMTDLGVTGSGFGVRVASAAAETRHVLVDRILSSVAGRLGRSVKELGDLVEPLLNAVFSMDAWGRGIAFVGRMLMGDSPEAARAAILRETVEYTRSATIPVEEWLKLFALFVTYARQRAGQVIEHILSYPGLAIGIEEMYRKRQEFIGFSPERVALNGGRPNWMGPEWIETPWSSPLINLPWAKVARPGPMLRAIDGEYALWTRFRIPALEEPGALVDYISRPATGFGQRAYPFRAVRMVEGVGPDKLVKPLARVPVIGPYFQEARRLPLREPDESIIQAVVRRLARTGVSDTAIESLVAREYETLQGITAPMARRKPWSEALSEWARQRHLVPPECRASLQVIKDHGVRAAMQYEIEKLKLYRDLAQFSSRTGIRVFAVPIEDLVNNMTESQLLMGRRAAEESLARGEKPYIMPERYDKELAERREGTGPRNWAEQTGSMWAPLIGAIERAGRRVVERRVGEAGGR